VRRFRNLMSVVLLSGFLAGLLLFAVQHFAIFPLIQRAEVYETAAEHAMPGMSHEEDEWHPSNGAERTLFTAVTTIASSIGFAALLFGIVALKPLSLDWKKGALWGLAAFACIGLAPAIGLPPQPPGVAVADLYARQIWWVATALLTAVGLWLLLDKQTHWAIRLIGLVPILLPHLIGAPIATGHTAIPADLVHEFALLSVLTTAIFWLALGSIGGALFTRFQYDEAQ
jgi:cobalt transporter subunit CbtA